MLSPRECALLLWGVAACGFDGRAGGANDVDASPPLVDAAPDAQPPPRLRCAFTYVDLCDRTPGGALTIDTDTTIDTSMDAACTHRIAQTSGAELCVVYASSITINAGATLRGVGTRPLVLAATGAINVAGRINVGSERAVPSATAERLGAGAASGTCAMFARTPEADQGGGAGGAGGSFAGAGGDGGQGDTNESAGGNDDDALGGRPNPTIASDTSAFLRGGCRGQAGGDSDGNPQGRPPGAGGPPGGAVYLVTPAEVTVLSTGGIFAGGGGGGGGGSQAGAGGGGSGGMIVIEGKAVHQQGVLAANGGGGGEGGVYFVDINTRVSGLGGSNALLAASRAPGGDTVTTPAPMGAGGTGSGPTGVVIEGNDGDDSPEGGCGGGGGAGYIRLFGAVDGSGTTTPPASS